MTRSEHRRTSERVAQGLLVLGAYYLVPIVEPLRGGAIWLRVATAVLLFGAAVWWICREIVLETRAADPPQVRPNRLLLLVLTGVMFFAVADLAVARAVPGEFTGLETKTDALYFALTTLITVGFGDISAQGQVARGLLIVQLAFNAVVLTRAIRSLSENVARRRTPPPPEPDHDPGPRAP